MRHYLATIGAAGFVAELAAQPWAPVVVGGLLATVLGQLALGCLARARVHVLPTDLLHHLAVEAGYSHARAVGPWPDGAWRDRWRVVAYPTSGPAVTLARSAWSALAVHRAIAALRAGRPRVPVG